ARRKSLFHLRQSEVCLFDQPFSQSRRQVADPREVELPFCIQRVIKLFAPVGRFSQRGTVFTQLFFRFAQQFHGVLRCPPTPLYRRHRLQRVSESLLKLSYFPQIFVRLSFSRPAPELQLPWKVTRGIFRSYR